MADDSADESSGSGGLPSYKGYEYQIHVTVWVALELMFDPELSIDRIEIEPASHEDIEAKLDVAPEKAMVTLYGSDLSIQVKYSSSEWKAADFRQLLADKEKQGKRGPDPRTRPLARLVQEPPRRYLLITNVGVAPKLRSYLVKDFKIPPHKAKPQVIVKAIPAGADAKLWAPRPSR